MTEPLFRGVGVALVSIFNEDGSLDAKASGELAARLVDLGIQAVLTAGSTGEAWALEPAERIELIAAVRNALPSGSTVPVLAGTGAASAYQAARLTAAAVDAGADGVLVLPPHGNVDLPRYYDTVVAAAGETPVLAYHFPTFSSPGISVAALRNLPVVGVKDSSGDPDRLLETLTTWDKPIYTGSAALLALAGPLGAAGAMLALGNVVPELAIRAWGGDVAAQLELTSTHLTAKGGFPRTIKALTAERFGTSPAVRMG